ncbi:hypothetical protein [Streptomyces sp. NPDC057557]|uniref:hypothetical protein n=1 Tax=Streptomyces sp. NPDC057557 TaxID=3346167 RepID=UPI0036750333
MRAPESSAGADGVVRAASGWADPVVTPQRDMRAVDGPLTGLQGPEASYPLMPAAVAGRDAGVRIRPALRHRYLRHGSGDVHLLPPEPEPHTPNCRSNGWSVCYTADVRPGIGPTSLTKPASGYISATSVGMNADRPVRARP